MTIQPDSWISYKALNESMIVPYHGELQRTGVISYGQTSYGYDARCGREFKIFTNINTDIIDPKRISESNFTTGKIYKDTNGSEYVIIPPNSYALTHTLERFKIPQDVVCTVLGKSTYARCGVIANVTPLEPGWEGHITLEFSNSTPLPVKMYVGEGAVQIQFHECPICDVPYNVRGGKYMNQGAQVVLPKVDK